MEEYVTDTHYLKRPTGMAIMPTSFLLAAHGSSVAVTTTVVRVPAPSTPTTTTGTRTVTAHGARRSLSGLGPDWSEATCSFKDRQITITKTINNS